VTPDRDLDLVLDGLVQLSREGMGGRDDRITHFGASRLPTSRLPKGAGACVWIRKSETSVDRSAARPARDLAFEKREMSCAARSGTHEIREVAVILAHSYRPGLGQSVPADFETRANRIFGTLAIGR
jgi:hypothetical protein